MSHALLKRYPSLYDLVYLSSYLYESESFLKCQYKEATPPWSAMSRAYVMAKDSDFIWRQGLSPASAKTADRMLIKTCFSAGPDDPLLLLCVRNRKPMAKSPWYADRFISQSEFQRNGQFAGIPEGEWLRSWAIIRLGETHDYFGALGELKKLTHSDERWYFGEKEDSRFPILGNYLRYVFYKLWLDQCVCYSEDAQMACFNTGLVNNRYEYIYAVFDRVPPVNGKVWNLKGFCIAGEQGLGKEVLRQFNPVPRPARFFTNTSELIYEVNYDLPLSAQLPYVDYSHIIHDNLNRFPLPFLQSACFGYRDILKLLDQASTAASQPDLDEIWEEIDHKIDDELFMRIKGQIERALHIAMRRVMWNYKTAIPVYFPVRNAISWLLPLALSAGSQADVALVVERFPNGNLEGHTILDLDMAYTNARLISKPESDWLSPNIIKMGDETRLVIENEAPEAAPPTWPAAAENTDPAPEDESPAKPGKEAPAPKREGGKKPSPKKAPTAEGEKKAKDAASKKKSSQPLKPPQPPKSKGEETKKAPSKSAKAPQAPKAPQSGKASKEKPLPSALQILQSQLHTISYAGNGAKRAADPRQGMVTKELVGRQVVLSNVTARKKHKGLQGMYQGTVVTVPQRVLAQEPASYAGKPLNVVITGINPQGNQYTAEPVLLKPPATRKPRP